MHSGDARRYLLSLLVACCPHRSLLPMAGGVSSRSSSPENSIPALSPSLGQMMSDGASFGVKGLQHSDDMLLREAGGLTDVVRVWSWSKNVSQDLSGNGERPGEFIGKAFLRSTYKLWLSAELRVIADRQLTSCRQLCNPSSRRRWRTPMLWMGMRGQIQG